MVLGLFMVVTPFWIVLVGASLSLPEVSHVPMQPVAVRASLREPCQGLGTRRSRPQDGQHLHRRHAGHARQDRRSQRFTAFSIVFFNFRSRMVIFWLIFITLMLPLEVRIVPTYAIAANALSAASRRSSMWWA
jgi:sn-glycerol 3-phosphate transport system permease protein